MSLKEKDYRWNFIVNAIDNAFFNLGMTFGSIQTLLPLFAKNLGAGNLEIGLIPAIANLGWAIPAILGARASERYKRKIDLVLKVTLGERLPYLFMSFIAFYLASSSPKLSLYLSLFLLAIATFSMGFLGPPWMSMISKVIHPSKRGTFFAMGNGLGAIMGIGGAFLARYFLSTYPFPINFGYSFLCAGIALLISLVFLSLTREEPDENEVQDISLIDYMKSIKIVFEDKNFRNYTISRILNTFSLSFMSFISVFSVKQFKIPDKIVADFTGILLISQALSSFIIGPIGDKLGHKITLLLGRIATIISLILLLTAKNTISFYIVYLFIGIINSAFYVGDLAFILDLSPNQRRELYLGSINLIFAPFSFIAPILAGKIADIKGYYFLFYCLLLLGIINILYFVYKVEDPKKNVKNIDNSDSN